MRSVKFFDPASAFDRVDVQHPLHFSRFGQGVNQHQRAADNMLKTNARGVLEQDLPAETAAAFWREGRHRGNRQMVGKATLSCESSDESAFFNNAE